MVLSWSAGIAGDQLDPRIAPIAFAKESNQGRAFALIDLVQQIFNQHDIHPYSM